MVHGGLADRNHHLSTTITLIQFSSGYLELLRLKGLRVRSNRNWMWFDTRFGWKFLYIIYFPQFFFFTFSYFITPCWRRYDERYHLKFTPG